ncbi:MAG: hypothetical protein ACYDBJ_16065 [Aggregatilineales bacterium]
MITQELVVDKILAHLNGQLGEHDLVEWAEQALFDLTESNGEIQNEVAVMDALMYLGAGDSSGFPLTWEVLSGFLQQLGMQAHVSLEPVSTRPQ